MEKRKQDSRTPKASRNTNARAMAEGQGVRGLLNLAAAFGVREACFRFGLSHASMRFGSGRTAKVKKLFLFQVQCQWAGRSPISAHSKIEMLPSPSLHLASLNSQERPVSSAHTVPRANDEEEILDSNRSSRAPPGGIALGILAERAR